jgi:hypothetical protein
LAITLAVAVTLIIGFVPSLIVTYSLHV